MTCWTRTLLKIADFGLAQMLYSTRAVDASRYAESGTVGLHRAVAGAGGRIDLIGPATDVYGLGDCALRECSAAGRRSRLRSRSGRSSIRWSSICRPSPSLRGVQNVLLAALEAICLKCLV